MNKITTVATLPGKSGVEVFRSIVTLKKEKLTEIRKAMKALEKTGGDIVQTQRGAKAWGAWRMAANAKECFRCQGIAKTKKEIEAEELESWRDLEARDNAKRKEKI